jgi:hypothetical protein
MDQTASSKKAEHKIMDKSGFARITLLKDLLQRGVLEFWNSLLTFQMPFGPFVNIVSCSSRTHRPEYAFKGPPTRHESENGGKSPWTSPLTCGLFWRMAHFGTFWKIGMDDQGGFIISRPGVVSSLATTTFTSINVPLPNDKDVLGVCLDVPMSVGHTTT